MFYKFMGGSDEDLLAVFDHAVVNGLLEFTSAAKFSEPFEFKFRSVAPDRDAYEAWHRAHWPDVTAEQREHGWGGCCQSTEVWRAEGELRTA